MANEKTPLRDTAPSAPQRAQKNADRSTVARRRVIVGIVVAVLVIGGVFFLFGGKDSPIAKVLPGNSSPDVSTFAFKTVVSGYTATVPKISKKEELKAAKAVTPNVQDVATALVQAGYVDPDSWGDAGAIDTYFTGPAADQVEPNIDTLTLGSDAGNTYESLDPGPSRIKVTALLDGDPKAIRAMADFSFTGKATLTDGSLAKVSVTGTLFLVPDGKDWKIEAFRIDREIKPTKAKASSASASPTSSESA